MSFDWMESSRPATDKGDRFRDQFVRAIRERARLFYDLGYPQTAATQRIEAAIRWEFDLGWRAPELPDFHAEIGALVDAVYARAEGRAPAPPKTRKRGGRKTSSRRSRAPAR